jgi:hypothetical protein
MAREFEKDHAFVEYDGLPTMTYIETNLI